MPFKYIIVEDEEGRWVCPIDESNKKIYVSHRYDFEYFFNMFKEGCIISIGEPGSEGILADNENK